MLDKKIGNDGWVRVSNNFADYCMTLLANDIASKKSLTLLAGSPTLANLTTKRSVDSVQHHFAVAGVPPTTMCQAILVKMIIDEIRIDPLTSLEDLKSFKERHRDELNNYRNGLDEITSMDVPEGIDYEGMVQRVKDIYERKVILACNDLKSALRGSNINFLTDISSLLYTGITSNLLDTIEYLPKSIKLLVEAGVYVAVSGKKRNISKKN